MQVKPVGVTSGIHALGTWPTCDMQAKPVGVTSGIHVPIYAGQLYMTIMHVLRLRASVSPSGVCFASVRLFQVQGFCIEPLPQ